MTKNWWVSGTCDYICLFKVEEKTVFQMFQKCIWGKKSGKGGSLSVGMWKF